MISTSLLCVLISNCSRDFLFTCGERSTVYLLILVGSGKQDFRTLSIDDPFSRFLEMEGNWVLNPIYRRRSGDEDKDVYEFTWFSENYKVECPQLEEIMAPRIELPKGLEALKPIEASREELLEMAKKLAVLNIPDNYA